MSEGVKKIVEFRLRIAENRLDRDVMRGIKSALDTQMGGS